MEVIDKLDQSLKNMIVGVLSVLSAIVGATRFNHRHRHVPLAPLGFPAFLVIDALAPLCLVMEQKLVNTWCVVTSSLRLARLVAEWFEIKRLSPLMAAVIGLVDLLWAHEEFFKARHKLKAGFEKESKTWVPEVGKAVLIVDVNIMIAVLFAGEDPHSIPWQIWGILVMGCYAASGWYMAVKCRAQYYCYVMAIACLMTVLSKNERSIEAAALVAFVAIMYFDSRQVYKKD